jgi:hypothetical protein
VKIEVKTAVKIHVAAKHAKKTITAKAQGHEEIFTAKITK